MIRAARLRLSSNASTSVYHEHGGLGFTNPSTEGSQNRGYLRCHITSCPFQTRNAPCRRRVVAGLVQDIFPCHVQPRNVEVEHLPRTRASSRAVCTPPSCAMPRMSPGMVRRHGEPLIHIRGRINGDLVSNYAVIIRGASSSSTTLQASCWIIDTVLSGMTDREENIGHDKQPNVPSANMSPQELE